MTEDISASKHPGIRLPVLTRTIDWPKSTDVSLTGSIIRIKGNALVSFTIPLIKTINRRHKPFGGLVLFVKGKRRTCDPQMETNVWRKKKKNNHNGSFSGSECFGFHNSYGLSVAASLVTSLFQVIFL